MEWNTFKNYYALPNEADYQQNTQILLYQVVKLKAKQVCISISVIGQ